MGCGQCSTGSCGSIKIESGDKTNAKTSGCSGGCSSGGCTKMNTFDWLSNLEQPKERKFSVVEVKFKGGRKEYFRNKNNLELYSGDFVVCQMASGYHIGSVSLQGELVRLQMSKRNIALNDDLPVVQRKATEKDVEKHNQAINRDLPAMYRSREICKDLKINLKLSEVEFQSDNSKAIFYYSADDRIDFRELIKVLANEFKVRIEMRQISLRQEAGRLGGIGSCGRELCCSTWLSDFKAIPTAAARYQNLSLNPVKLSGQCGRLKCCLNYELTTYIDAIKDIPTVERPLQTEKGDASLQKTDIFRKIMWFSYPNETNWHAVPCSMVVEIQKMNAQGKKPQELENLTELGEMPETKPSGLNSDLEKLDKKYGNKKNKSWNRERADKPRNDRGDRGPRPENTRSENSRPENTRSENRGPQQQNTPGSQAPRPPQSQRPPQNQNNPTSQAARSPQNQASSNPNPGGNPQGTTEGGAPRPKKKKKFRNNRPPRGNEPTAS
ncbi:MAG: PSP1 domain-containing protein [Leadbetterella sp.]